MEASDLTDHIPKRFNKDIILYLSKTDLPQTGSSAKISSKELYKDPKDLKMMIGRFSLYGFLKNQQYYEYFLILAFRQMDIETVQQIQGNNIRIIFFQQSLCRINLVFRHSVLNQKLYIILTFSNRFRDIHILKGFSFNYILSSDRYADAL